MPLQTSGQISLLNIQQEFGETGIIRLSNFYGKTQGIPLSGNPIKISNFHGKSSIPSLPVTSGLYARYTGDGPFTKTGTGITSWNDISGQNRHITTYRGASQEISRTMGTFGTTGTGTFKAVSGTINDGFKMPFALPQNNNSSVSSYTIAYIARYTGDRNNISGNNRIFDSASGAAANHIWGFHGNVNGRSHDGKTGWRTYYFYKQSDPHYWMIGLETELSSRYNGIDWTMKYTRATDNYFVPRKSTDTPIFTINFGAYSGDGNTSECSNWEVAELIFYDRELSLNEQISLENFLALKYGHISFSNVVPTLNAYKLLTSNTALYDSWYNIWNGAQHAYYNSLWNGPGLGEFKTINNLGYFGMLFLNDAVTRDATGYSNRNRYQITYNFTTPSNISKAHIIVCGGGGGGGSGYKGGGAGAGGMTYVHSQTNLSDVSLNIVCGSRGREGAYFSGNQPSSGGDTMTSFSISGTNYTLTGFGGNQGPNNTTVGGVGGSYSITPSITNSSGGNGGDGVNINSANVLPPGGAIHTPTNITFSYAGGKSATLWNIATTFGIASYNVSDWYTDTFSGNGGNGAGIGSDGYARNARHGGHGWVLVIFDNTT
jgi:hypothetical protein